MRSSHIQISLFITRAVVGDMPEGPFLVTYSLLYLLIHEIEVLCAQPHCFPGTSLFLQLNS
jgi:hypothetical protein